MASAYHLLISRFSAYSHRNRINCCGDFCTKYDKLFAAPLCKLSY